MGFLFVATAFLRKKSLYVGMAKKEAYNDKHRGTRVAADSQFRLYRLTNRYLQTKNLREVSPPFRATRKLQGGLPTTLPCEIMYQVKRQVIKDDELPLYVKTQRLVEVDLSKPKRNRFDAE